MRCCYSIPAGFNPAELESVAETLRKNRRKKKKQQKKERKTEKRRKYIAETTTERCKYERKLLAL